MAIEELIEDARERLQALSYRASKETLPRALAIVGIVAWNQMQLGTYYVDGTSENLGSWAGCTPSQAAAAIGVAIRCNVLKDHSSRTTAKGRKVWRLSV